jgi:hypothetical protein
MLQPEVVLSGTAQSIHILGGSYRISDWDSCAGRRLREIRPCVERGPEAAAGKPLPVIFGRKLTNNRPLLGPGSYFFQGG